MNACTGRTTDKYWIGLSSRRHIALTNLNTKLPLQKVLVFYEEIPSPNTPVLLTDTDELFWKDVPTFASPLLIHSY